ncbi:four helix bundle protein [Hymenobacter lucidus]|uniref:Four helix bundle protein n=1 Tax=Hymenobacter lucidus TaxID=2880930 RepID=A0ABS8AXX4_9BACT|nr:four helix bundle protein [Hymenobacter lucidus]MCB2410623.1 four helix bundle protein [Hymenobacter lucidus]
MEDATRHFRLGDVEAYRISFALSNCVWDAVVCWNYLAQNTVGAQFVRAVDSVSANLAEGFGRYGKKDKIKFYRIARGSLMEALDWNEKAKIRQLLTIEQYTHIFTQLQLLPKSINTLIKYTNTSLKE